MSEGSVLFDGTTGTTPASGAGTRLMWIPATGAFRVGEVTGAAWDDANIGGGSTVTGGADNTASGANSTVGGGEGNVASTNYTTVSGGNANSATANNATVGGGNGNTASGMNSISAGGNGNTASGQKSVVAGGLSNQATGTESAVGGGGSNIASGTNATVPGGTDNEAAGNYSFAAGRRAKANHNGTFVWADDTNADFASTATDQFIIRAGAGVGIGTDAPAGQLDVQGGGVVVGAPTGGDLGAGTINAEAVYDDNALLADYVFDWYFDGEVHEDDRERHGSYRMLTLEETAVFMEREHHLPTIMGRDEWAANGRASVGELTSQLWETVETQAIYIVELEQRLDAAERQARRRESALMAQAHQLRQLSAQVTDALARIDDMQKTQTELVTATGRSAELGYRTGTRPSEGHLAHTDQP